MKTQVEILRYLAELRNAQNNLADYAAFTLEVVPALHHRLICEHIDALLADEFDELIINTPPGAAKSTYTSHALGAYFIGKFPTKNVILATHTADLSERWSRKVRNTVTSAMHLKLFPHSGLSKDSTAVSRWATSEGGELLAAGVGGSILGFRADLGIIDDPISGFEQAQSITQLQKVHSWYETDFVTRLKPGAKVVLICQRLSPNDMAGYLIARNEKNPTRRQKILILRMEAEEGEEDPLGRAPGERLWPEWYTPEMVEDAKRDDFKWMTLYQQRPPSDTGSWVAPDEVQFVEAEEVPEGVINYMLSDLALSVNSGDYSVHGVVSVATNHDIYVRHVWRGRTSIDQTAAKHLSLVEDYSPTESLIDDDNMAKVYIQLIARMARERGVPVPLKMLPMRGQDKETRAAPLRGWFKRKKIFLVRDPSWNGWLYNELMQFPNALGDGVDDGVDMLSLIGRRLASVATAAPATPPKARDKTWQDATLNDLWEDREHKRGLSARRV